LNGFEEGKRTDHGSVYLNSIERGTGIYGVEMTAKNYYGKHVYELTCDEVALIAAILLNPLKRNPAKPSVCLREKQEDILLVNA
jgi:membrane peptidoglycan carboxypeptidase